MKEIKSAQDLVDSLANAGNELVIVDFYSPGCGGCKALHPKIKKFRDALVKHSTERCSLGPAKGLEESELLALDANKDLSFTYRKKPVSIPEPFPSIPNLPVVQPSRASQQSSDKSLVIAWR